MLPASLCPPLTRRQEPTPRRPEEPAPRLLRQLQTEREPEPPPDARALAVYHTARITAHATSNVIPAAVPVVRPSIALGLSPEFAPHAKGSGVGLPTLLEGRNNLVGGVRKTARRSVDGNPTLAHDRAPTF